MLILSEKGDNEMSERTVFKKGGSLYVNLPKDVVNKSGVKEGQQVSVSFLWGLGIVVGKPGNEQQMMRMFDNFEPSMVSKKSRDKS